MSRHQTTGRYDPLDAPGGDEFVRFSDKALANIDALLKAAVKDHQGAVERLDRFLNNEDIVEVEDIGGVARRYMEVVGARERIDMLAALRDRGGIWI